MPQTIHNPTTGENANVPDDVAAIAIRQLGWEHSPAKAEKKAEKKAEPKSETPSVIDGTVDDVVARIGDNAETATQVLALEQERGDKARKGVLDHAEAVIAAAKSKES